MGNYLLLSLDLWNGLIIYLQITRMNKNFCPRSKDYELFAIQRTNYVLSHVFHVSTTRNFSADIINRFPLQSYSLRMKHTCTLEK